MRDNFHIKYIFIYITVDNNCKKGNHKKTMTILNLYLCNFGFDDRNCFYGNRWQLTEFSWQSVEFPDFFLHFLYVSNLCELWTGQQFLRGRAILGVFLEHPADQVLYVLCVLRVYISPLSLHNLIGQPQLVLQDRKSALLITTSIAILESFKTFSKIFLLKNYITRTAQTTFKLWPTHISIWGCKTRTTWKYSYQLHTINYVYMFTVILSSAVLFYLQLLGKSSSG